MNVLGCFLKNNIILLNNKIHVKLCFTFWGFFSTFKIYFFEFISWNIIKKTIIYLKILKLERMTRTHSCWADSVTWHTELRANKSFIYVRLSDFLLLLLSCSCNGIQWHVFLGWKSYCVKRLCLEYKKYNFNRKMYQIRVMQSTFTNFVRTINLLPIVLYFQ